jgi:hypothetical protein
MSVVERTRVSQVTPEHPAFPAQWFTAYVVLSPVIGLSCHRRPRKLVFANLTPASRRQDHTILPSASRAIRQRHISVHRIPSRIRDDRETPLRLGRDGRRYKVIWLFGKSEYFCKGGWTGFC